MYTENIQFSIDTIKDALRKSGMPTDHADSVSKLIKDGDISWDDFKETLPRLQELDLEDGITNNGHTTITEDQVIIAQYNDHKNAIMDWQQAKGYTGGGNYPIFDEQLNFSQLLDKWVQLEWNKLDKKTNNTSPEQYFINKHKLGISTEEFNKLITGEAAPSEELLHKLLENFPQKQGIGYSRTFVSQANQIMDNLPQIANNGNGDVVDYEIPSPGKQLAVWMAIGGIKMQDVADLFGNTRFAIYDWIKNSRYIPPSRMDTLADFLGKIIPSFKEEEKQKFFDAAKRYYQPPSTVKNFKECLCRWQAICGMSKENFDKEINNRLKFKESSKCRFDTLSNGVGLTVPLLDTIADFLEERTKNFTNKELRFTDKERSEFYCLAAKHFHDVSEGKTFKELSRGWRKTIGLYTQDFLNELSRKLPDSPHHMYSIYSWEEGNGLTINKAKAMAEVFAEQTELNKSDIFRFNEKDKERFIKAANELLKNKKGKKTFVEIVQKVRNPDQTERL